MYYRVMDKRGLYSKVNHGYFLGSSLKLYNSSKLSYDYISKDTLGDYQRADLRELVLKGFALQSANLLME